MLICKRNRIWIVSYLYREGTLVIKKNETGEFNIGEDSIPNIEVLSLLRSFSSQGYVMETFHWQYYYYTLTAEGMFHFQDYLGLPGNIYPKIGPRCISWRTQERIKQNRKGNLFHDSDWKEGSKAQYMSSTKNLFKGDAELHILAHAKKHNQEVRMHGKETRLKRGSDLYRSAKSSE